MNVVSSLGWLHYYESSLDGANGGAIDCKRVGIWYFGLLSFLHFWVGFYIWAMGGLGHQDFLKHLESQKVSLDL